MLAPQWLLHHEAVVWSFISCQAGVLNCGPSDSQSGLFSFWHDQVVRVLNYGGKKHEWMDGRKGGKEGGNGLNICHPKISMLKSNLQGVSRWHF